MVIERAGAPWITYYWGYKLGLVESQSDWNDEPTAARCPLTGRCSRRRKTTSNSDPCHPLGRRGSHLRYVNTADFPRQPDGRISTPHRMRTAPRLTASPPGGAPATVSSRVATSALPFLWWRQRRTEHPLLQRQRHRSATGSGRELFLSYEGQTFRVNKPLPLAANAPVGHASPVARRDQNRSRLYNNASAPGKNYVSNHRYVTSRTVVDASRCHRLAR